MGANSAKTDKTYKWRKLPKGLVSYAVPTKIESMLCGVSMVKQDNTGKVTLFYTDGTTETAHCPDIEVIEPKCFFSLVSTVQEKRQFKGLPIK